MLNSYIIYATAFLILLLLIFVSLYKDYRRIKKAFKVFEKINAINAKIFFGYKYSNLGLDKIKDEYNEIIKYCENNGFTDSTTKSILKNLEWNINSLLIDEHEEAIT